VTEAERFLELYRRMRLIRRFEDEVQSLSTQGLVHGTARPCSGREAGLVGVCDALGEADRVAGTDLGHALALGVDPPALLAELLGRATGVCGGRAGLNVVDLEHRLIGCFGVGGSIAAATGAALALKRAGGVAVGFFGDGATNQGYFHECLNFAKVHDLPVIYVCENDRYGESGEQLTAGEIAARPQALGLPTITIDGSDVWTARRTAAEAVARVRAGRGPHFIEALTSRYVGHSGSDPLVVARTGLAERYGTSAETMDRVDAEVEEQIAATVRAAIEAPFPAPGAPAREFAP
jgi:TPP-dependent pyruvate/acetoin dehydrogenase alpha subunit